MVILALALLTWAGIAVVGWARRGGRGRRVRTAPSPAKPAAWVAVLALVAGAAVHAYGLSYLPYLFPEDACWFNAGIKVSPDSSGMLPVSLVCAGEEVVPGWLNPTLLALAVTAVVAAGAAVVLRVRAREHGA
ncbi:hypothetical protein [Streptomyces showdoensis]|uniref:Uncharacterized protein n=1 Tax=Streptomyces showdoensis TaxID=68268 RepID=A0A2P2GTV8_STREW|nr:hypothetical protein [Streptomyces showdoensis]KKZ74940.1 hypothetical protein VO63_05745 [Streptomyces showdoensis]